jgi:Ubiquitin carboxyl-terminal hydrolase, family 1.
MLYEWKKCNFFRIQLGDGHLKQFLDDSKALSPNDRGELLLKADGIINTHKELSLEGQTEASEPSLIKESHVFLCVNDRLSY